MKFLCDVHISYKLNKYLIAKGFESVHIYFILEKWTTKDSKIYQYADENNLIVITKDQDFRNSYIFQNTPKKLIRVVLGNISNHKLLDLFERHLNLIVSLKDENQFFVEIGDSFVVYSH